MPEFVSNKLRKIANVGVAVALATTAYAATYANYFQNRQYDFPSLNQNKPAVIGNYDPDSSRIYDPRPDERVLPMHYFDGFVGFFNTETKGIGIVPNSHAPAENGFYSWEHIRLHEGLHWRADRAGLVHDEAWFNRLAANRLAGRSGTDRFPFPSYLSYSMF